MEAINSKQQALSPFFLKDAAFSPGLPTFIPCERDFESRFEEHINREILSLYDARRRLADKLAKARINPGDQEQKQELIKEYAYLEQKKKFIAILIEAIEKSRQCIAANFR